MEIFIAEQCKSLAESCIIGLIFGAGYDIIRILYVLWGIQSYKQKTVSDSKAAFWMFLAGDVLFMLTVTIGASVFLYHVSHGRLRLFLVIGCIAGFRLYQCTIGRLVMHLSEAIVAFLKKLIFYTVIRPMRWFFRILWGGTRIVFRFTAGKVYTMLSNTAAQARMRRCMRRFPELVRL